MNDGVNFAHEFNLVPDMALTAGRMNSLTSDIVWRVNQTVTLFDAYAIPKRCMAPVARHGATLISGAFTGLLNRYRLRSANGHEWQAQGRKISEGSRANREPHPRKLFAATRGA
ncbi:hypothetical protein [Caballeronia sp. GAFFF1]|uniref:hypothetical protein n=1 Tax=Caballeronia sp. GAFFF1 TaxID=2921779 RepID=UPI002028DE8E|nr:hypothetical protein [Caballeronia sp. GAFFF1]